MMTSCRAGSIVCVAQCKMKMRGSLFKEWEKKVSLKVLKCKTVAFHPWSLSPSVMMLFYLLLNVTLPRAWGYLQDKVQTLTGTPGFCPTAWYGLSQPTAGFTVSPMRDGHVVPPTGDWEVNPPFHRPAASTMANRQPLRCCSLCTRMHLVPGCGGGQEVSPCQVARKCIMALPAQSSDGHYCALLRHHWLSVLNLDSPCTCPQVPIAECSAPAGHQHLVTVTGRGQLGSGRKGESGGDSGCQGTRNRRLTTCPGTQGGGERQLHT